MINGKRILRILLFPAAALLVALVLHIQGKNRVDTGPVFTDSPVVADGARVEKIAGGFVFTEGPAARSDTLYFTEHRENEVWRWTPDGGTELFWSGTGGVGGLYFTADGDLAATASRSRSIVVRNMATGEVRELARGYGDKNYNGPNDLWVAPDGGVYFTDPDFGRRPSDFGGGRVFHVAPDGRVTSVIEDMLQPNGVIGTPDGRTLYVVDDYEEKTWAFDIRGDGTLANRRLFAPEGIDGATMDERGNVYIAADRILVYTPAGELIETIDVPEQPSNCCFGGRDGKTLFITARTSVYALEMKVRGT